MADTTRLVGPDDQGGVWIQGTLTVARPVGAIVRNTADGLLYASTNAVVPAYVLIGGTAGGGSVVETAADPYNVTTTDLYVLLTGTGQTVNLPAGGTHTGGIVTIKDKSGSAFSSPVTVNANGAETIDGAGSLTLDADYVSITMVFAGTEWSLT